MARGAALAAAIAVSLLAVSGAGGSGAQTPRKGGTVVFGPVAEFGCLTPFKDCAVGPEFFWIFEKVLPGAFALARDSTWRPTLVSGVTFTRTPPYTLTYTIRPEARWSDGVPVTAGDFRFTHRAIRKYGSADDAHRTFVRSVRAVDAKTFRVVLRSRFAGWRGSLFGFVLPQHALAGKDLTRIWTDGIDNPKTGRPIGSGPLLVAGWARGEQLTLVRNPSYWGLHKAYLDGLIIRFCQRACVAPPPAEVLESMRTGAVFAYTRDTEIVPDLRRIRGTTVRLLRTNGYEHVDFRVDSGGHPALQTKRVRQAFAYSIDRAEIVRRLWGEFDPTYRPLQSAVLLNTDRDYAPNWSGYSYRPNLARSLLERAGCRRGADRIYACGSQRLSFRFSTLPSKPRQLGLELMQTQLRRVGIEVVPSYSPGPAFVKQTSSGDFDVVSFSWSGGDGFGQKHLYGCGADLNWPGYCQRLVTADLDQADRILDDAQRARVLNRVDRQLAKDVPVIPLYQIPWVYAYKDTLRNIVPSPSNLLWNAEDWWLER